MTGRGPPDALRAAQELAGFTITELWLRYVALGGTAAPSKLAAFMRGEQPLGDVEHDMLVHALNERFVEMELNHPVPYRSGE